MTNPECAGRLDSGRVWRHGSGEHHRSLGMESDSLESAMRRRLSVGARARRTTRCSGPGLALLAPGH